MSRLFCAVVIGTFLFASLVPTAKAAAPIAAAQVVVGNHEKRPESQTRMSLDSAPPGWNLVSYEDDDTKAEKQLPARVMERGAGKVGAAAGSALGTAAGYALFGLPGALVAGSVGAVIGEVFFEVFISNLFRGAVSGPLMPRMNPRWIPVK